MNYDMSSSNIAPFLLIRYIQITPYRRQSSMTIIDWWRRREEEEAKWKTTCCITSISIMMMTIIIIIIFFYLSMENLMDVERHLVTPLAYIFKMSLGWIICMRTKCQDERERERKVYFISVLEQILVTFLLLLLRLPSSSHLVLSLTEHLIMSMNTSICYASQCASRFLWLTREDKEMMLTTCNRVIS